MSAAAVKAGSGEGLAAVIARHPDLVVMAIGFPIFVFAELPLAAYALAVATWFAQALIIARMNARAAASDDPRSIIGYTVGGFVVRAWIAATGLVIAAVAFDDRAGLAAALLLIAMFTAYFLQRVISHSTPGGGAV